LEYVISDIPGVLVLCMIELYDSIHHQLVVSKSGGTFILDLITKSRKDIFNGLSYKLYKLDESKILLSHYNELIVWNYIQNIIIAKRNDIDIDIAESLTILDDGKILYLSQINTDIIDLNGDEFDKSNILILDPNTLNILSETETELRLDNIKLFYDNKIIMSAYDSQFYNTLNIWNPTTQIFEMILPLYCHVLFMVLLDKKIAILGSGSNHYYIEIRE